MDGPVLRTDPRTARRLAVLEWALKEVRGVTDDPHVESIVVRALERDKRLRRQSN